MESNCANAGKCDSARFCRGGWLLRKPFPACVPVKVNVNAKRKGKSK